MYLPLKFQVHTSNTYGCCVMLQKFFKCANNKHAYGYLLQRKVVLDDNSLQAHDDCLLVLDDR